MKEIPSRETSGSPYKRVRAWHPATACQQWVLVGACFFLMFCSLAAHAETVTTPIRQYGTGLLNKAAWSPDEKFIATGGPRGGVYLWDAATGEQVRTFMGHTGAVSAVAFSADGKWLVTGSDDLTVRLWEVATGRQLQLFSGHTDWVTSVAIARDGTKILSGSRDKTARLWDVTTGKLSATLSGHTATVSAVAISPDGKKALTGALYPDSCARLWDLATAKMTYTLNHTNSVYALTFSPDGKQVASSADEACVRLWSAVTGQLTGFINLQFGGTYVATFALAYSADGTTLYAGVEGYNLQWGTPGYYNENYCVYSFNVARGSLVRHMSGNTDRIHSLALSADGTRVMAGSFDGTVRTWQASDGSPLQALKLHSYRIDSLAFSPDGKTILVGEKDGTARLWDWRSGVQRMEIREATTTVTATYPGIRRCAFSPSGARFLTSMPDGLVHVRETATGLPVATINTDMTYSPDALFAPNEREILTSGTGGARRWDLATGHVTHTLGAANADGLALSRNGLLLAASSGNSTKIWNTQSGDWISTCTGGSTYTSVICAEFLPDGKRLLAGYSDGSLILWDATTGAKLQTILLKSYPTENRPDTYTAIVYNAAISPNGADFLSAGTYSAVNANGLIEYRGMAWLWNLGSGSVVRAYDHHEQRNIEAGAFSPDGAFVLTGSDDGTVALWKSDPSRTAVDGWKAFE